MLKPEFFPTEKEVGFGQEVQIKSDPATVAELQKLAKDGKGEGKIRFNYTLNKEDIPTPYQGQPYDISIPSLQIKLTKEVLGPGVNKAELKVIGFREGKMPSLVATRTYILKEDGVVTSLGDGPLVERPLWNNLVSQEAQ